MIDSMRRIPGPVWVGLLIAFGLMIRLGSLDFQSLWRDEVDALRFGRDLSAQLASALSGGGVTGVVDQLRLTLTQPGFNGPAYFLMLSAWTGAAGLSGYALRFPSTLFGILAIPLTYVLVKRLFRSTRLEGQAGSVALLAAGLTAISPYFNWYSQEAKMYTEITALALLAIYGLRRATYARPGARTWPWWLLLVAATTLAMYSHILAALLIGVEVALFALWWPNARRHWRGGAIALAVLTLPYLPLLGWQLQLAFTPGDQGFARYRFDDILRVMISGLAYGVLPFEYTLGQVGIRWDPTSAGAALNPANWGVWLFSVLAILGALMWKDAKDRAQRLALAAWILLPAAAIAIISINRPVFTDRYLIWIGPAVYVLAALGMHELWRWKKALGSVTLALVAFAALASLYGQATTPFKPDFRSGARYIQTRYQGEPILFQIPYGRYTFAYYFGAPFQAIDGPYTNRHNPDGSWERDAASYDVEIAASLAGQKNIWLVTTEVEMWDERHLLDNWLNRHGRVTDRADFTRVSVARYALGP